MKFPGVADPIRRGILLATALSGFIWVPDSRSETSPGESFRLEGTQLGGAPYSISGSRGKVVMVVYWSTDCAPCLTKMPELRANAMGWRGKPFELVLVSVDKNRADALRYDLLLEASGSADQRIPSLWAGEAGFADSLSSRPARLPLTLVLDTKGRVAARYEGRMAPEAWNNVADLIP